MRVDGEGVRVDVRCEGDGEGMRVDVEGVRV